MLTAAFGLILYNCFFNFMVRYGQECLYINHVCLICTIHTADTDICAVDRTGGARREAAIQRTNKDSELSLGCSCCLTHHWFSTGIRSRDIWQVIGHNY